MKSRLEHADYVQGLDQLFTVSCILAGFSFSGLIALPGISRELFDKFVQMVSSNVEFALLCTFYTLFFATVCFLGTIMTVFVYKVGNYFVPMNKLRRIYLVANLVFSLAIASLMISVVSFGVPTREGMVVGVAMGVGVAACFIWENMVTWQRKKREEQIEREKKTPQDEKPEQHLLAAKKADADEGNKV